MGDKFGLVAVEIARRAWTLAKRMAIVFGFVLASACSDEPEPPIASAPFNVAREGHAVSVPFVIPASSDPEAAYVLAFKYRSPEVGDPLMQFWSRPRGAHLLLKVRLVYIADPGGEHEVRVTSYDNGDGSVQAAARRGPGVLNVDIYGVRRDIVYMEVGHFKAPLPGAYRLEIETVDRQEIFDSITSWITVERDFSHYK